MRKFKMSIFEEEEGVWSARRTIALMFSFLLILATIFIFVFRVVWDWKIYLVLLGIPALIILLCLLFTTWSDLSMVVSWKQGNAEPKQKQDSDSTLETKPDPNEL